MTRHSIYAAEAEALLKIYDALGALEQTSAEFVLKTAQERLNIVTIVESGKSKSHVSAVATTNDIADAPKVRRGRGKGRPKKVVEPIAQGDIDPKAFIAEKQPDRQAEVIACLAYILVHGQGQKKFKTRDITQIYNQTDGQAFGNATTAMQIATKNGYLSVNGRIYKLTSFGTDYVNALPDREAAEEIRRSAGMGVRRVNKAKGRPKGKRDKKAQQKQAA